MESCNILNCWWNIDGLCMHLNADSELDRPCPDYLYDGYDD